MFQTRQIALLVFQMCSEVIKQKYLHNKYLGIMKYVNK